MPTITTRALLRALARHGFRRVRQRGSHVVMERKDWRGTRQVVVPVHRGDVKPGTLGNILRLAGMTFQELLEVA